MIFSTQLPERVFRLLECITHIDDRFLVEAEAFTPQELATFKRRYRQAMERYKKAIAVAGACVSVATVAVLWMHKQRSIAT